MRTINVSVTVRVLVTDGASFVMGHVIRMLLEEGFTIRALVPQRSEETDYLLELGRKHENRLEMHFVDIRTNVGVLAHLMCDVDCVIHSALYGISPDESLAALHNVLSACTKQDRVRKFVLSSSWLTLHETPELGRVYGPSDWNSVSTFASSSMHFTETHTELTFFEWAPQLLPRTCNYFSIVRGMAVGPPPGQKCSLSWEMKMLAGIIEGSWRRVPDLAFGFVDVRDVAKAHMMGLLQRTLPSPRYVVVNQTLHLHHIASLMYHDVPRFCPAIPKQSMGASTTKLLTYAFPMWLCTGTRRKAEVRRILPSVCAFHVTQYPLYDGTAAKADLHLTYRAITATCVETVIGLADMGVIVDVSGPPPKEEEGDYYYQFT